MTNDGGVYAEGVLDISGYMWKALRLSQGRLHGSRCLIESNCGVILLEYMRARVKEGLSVNTEYDVWGVSVARYTETLLKEYLSFNSWKQCSKRKDFKEV